MTDQMNPERAFSPWRETLSQLRTQLPAATPAPIERDRIPQAAVTLLLQEWQGDPRLLIIKRAHRAGDPWSGHLALPGGRVDPDDEDLIVTAVRETREEVGIDLNRMGGARELFLGRLTPLQPRNPQIPPLEIVPFVAVIPETWPQTRPMTCKAPLNEEVEATYWLSLIDLKTHGRSDEYRYRSGTLIERWPAYPTIAGPIWGITERILTDLISRLDPKE
jgi:8-oxo-dGTP pyrophosphatase MutT (NUDIX family)